MVKSIKVVGAVVLFGLYLLGYIPSIFYSNKSNEVEFSKLCLLKTAVSEAELYAHLAKFYEGTTIDYDHRSTKIKPIPEFCLENLFIKLDKNVSLNEYRSKKAEKFEEIEAHYNNLDAVSKRHQLIPIAPIFEEDGGRYKLRVNQKILDAELNSMKNSKDDDLKNLDVLRAALNKKSTEFNVPNLIHYIWFGKHTYRVIDYICMLSALRKQQPDLILVHGDVEPEGKLWEWLKDEAGSKLKFVKKYPPTTIFGNKLTKVEHQSDVARLHILLQVGGIYLDTDTMVLKSLNQLRRKEKAVMGMFSEIWLGNAAILSNKNSSFLRRWFYQYSDFDGNDMDLFVKWSMKVPMMLSLQYPDEIHVEKTRMMRPNKRREELHAFFRGLIDLTDHYTVHVNARWQKDYDKQRNRTIAQLAVLKTTYGEVARRALWDDPAVKDVTPWVLHPGFNKTLVVEVRSRSTE